jgi:hypothetical protein
VSGAVLSAGDRIRAIVQLGREAREADAEAKRVQAFDSAASWDAIGEADARWTDAVNAITDHLAALESTGVLEAIAEAADLFDGGRA